MEETKRGDEPARRLRGWTKVLAFAGLLIAAFGIATAAGAAIGPQPSSSDEHSDPEHGETAMSAGGHEGMSEEAEGAAAPGVQVASNGLRLETSAAIADADPAAPFEFTVVDDGGEPVSDFEIEHERAMHFIVVRRDLTGFQHLHPEMDSRGTWSTPVDLSRSGSYRVYADFVHDGAKETLAADVEVEGTYRPSAVPPPKETAMTESGLEVTLAADPDDPGRVEFQVSRDGRPVDGELEPYLGAKGHLVTLRTGDLAYLHTHPDGDELAFEVEYPSTGIYRLFVQFRYAGKVHTAAFTQEVSP